MKTEKNKLLMILMLSLLAFSCSKKEAAEEMEVAVKDEITAVKVEEITKSNLYDFFTTNGNVRVADSLEVYSAVSGRIVRVSAKLGQKVSKGDVIAVIDPGVSGGNFALYKLTAPASGTILSTPPAAGSILSTENRFTIMGNLENLQIVSYVPERFYGRLKAGLKAKVQVEAYEGQHFNAKVSDVSPVIDEENRTCEVTLSLSDKNSQIVAGMFTDVSIILEEFKNQISVPEDCVVNRDGESFVYKVQNGAAVLCPVQTGNVYNHRRIILEGISEGDLVITEGYETVTEGGSVNVVMEAIYESN